MREEFRFNIYRRLIPVVVGFLILPVIYGFLLEGFQRDNLVYSILCFSCALLFFLSLYSFFAQAWKTIILTDQGLTIKSFFVNRTFKWEEIDEFGRFRKMVYGGGAWSYYLKSLSTSSKRIIIGLEHYENMPILNNLIIKKAKNAKIKNTQIQSVMSG